MHAQVTKPNPKNEPRDQTRKRKVDALGGPTPEQMAARQESSAAAMAARNNLECRAHSAHEGTVHQRRQMHSQAHNAML